MLYLAEKGGSEPVSLKEASSARGISRKYLEQIAMTLTTANLVVSVRGANGGYRLARRADAISLLDVLRATEGSLEPVAGLSADGEFDMSYLEERVWNGLAETVEHYLGSLTLGALVERYSQVAADSYSI